VGDEERESKIENGRAILTGSLIVGRSGLSARTRAGSVGPPRSISAAQHSPFSSTSENEASLTRVSPPRADDADDASIFSVRNAKRAGVPPLPRLA
jgi:hypothetical protein